MSDAKPDARGSDSMPATELPTKSPRTNLDSEPFWEATAEGRFTLQRCDACETVIWWPRAVCPECSSFDLSWFDASGEGKIYSYTVVHRSLGRWNDATPYVLAYVELDEGPRVMTNIVDGDGTEAAGGAAIDKRVRVIFHDTGEGNALPRFTLI